MGGSMLRIYLIIFSLFALCGGASAESIKAQADNSYKAVISNYDANRVGIKGGFITSVTGPKDGRVIMEEDEASGTIFIRLNKGVGSNNDPFTLYIRDSKKNDYTLLLSPAKVPGTHVYLELAKKEVVNNSFMHKTLRRNELIQHMMSKMIAGESISRCEEKSFRKLHKLWRGTRFYELKTITCGKIRGRVYDLVNMGDKMIRIAEQEFYKLGVVAVSISQAELVGSKQPQASAKIYVIEEVSNGN